MELFLHDFDDDIVEDILSYRVMLLSCLLPPGITWGLDINHKRRKWVSEKFDQCAADSLILKAGTVLQTTAQAGFVEHQQKCTSR